SCNDESVLSDCRWEEWTCTIDTSHSACYTRRTRREDGYIKQDEGCVNTAWNPTFCGRASETQAVLCCNDSDMCNQYFTPTFLPRAIVTSTKAPQSISNIHTFSLVRDTVTLRVSSTILELSTSHALSTLLSTTTEGTFSVSSAPTKTPSPTSQPGLNYRPSCSQIRFWHACINSKFKALHLNLAKLSILSHKLQLWHQPCCIQLSQQLDFIKSVYLYFT
ncbi:hypothetical protein GBAR_LOCUS22624, partial [Geodia barretti]